VLIDETRSDRVRRPRQALAESYCVSRGL
jgi:hypothetical protein